MGMPGPVSKSSYDSYDSPPIGGFKRDEGVIFGGQPCPPAPPNPDPTNFTIERYNTVMGKLVVKVNYPDCINYEGNKILVFRNTTMADLQAQGSIDPHFSENRKFHSPIARFVPTEEGWRNALKFATL